MKYTIGIDIGTSSCKVVLIDRAGNSVAGSSQEYFAEIGTDGRAEQDPEDWYRACVDGIRQAVRQPDIKKEDVVALSVTGQMQGITLVGEDGQPVRKSILWSDIRSEPDVRQANDRYADVFRRRCLVELGTAHTLSKILWLRRVEPESWQKTSQFMYASNYITYRLTDVASTDESNIGYSAMNDVKANGWADEILDLFSIEREKLPKVLGCFDQVGGLGQQAAQATGLRVGTPVIAGGGDAPAESYSIGLAGTGRLKIRLGSAADLNCLVHESQFGKDGAWEGMRDMVRGYILIVKYTKACAQSVKWMRKVFFSECAEDAGTYAVMDGEAATAPPSADGLLYHPYLLGEYAPYFDTSLRGKFTGMNMGHTRAHFMRAAYEGVCFSILDALQKTRAFNGCDEIVLVGGGTKSQVWTAILADVLGMDARIPVQCDAAFGAALMAGQAVGLFESSALVQKSMRAARLLRHDPQNHAVYQGAFEKYMELAGK